VALATERASDRALPQPSWLACERPTPLKSLLSIADASPVRAHVGSLGMGLLATHRGQGLGRRLLTLAIDRTRERELECIELSVLHDNDAARALYERLGFQIEGRRIRDWRRDGVYRDSILMALNLVPR
jgi:RimJ/RimL family protein N-acetyltransferase